MKANPWRSSRSGLPIQSSTKIETNSNLPGIYATTAAAAAAAPPPTLLHRKNPIRWKYVPVLFPSINRRQQASLVTSVTSKTEAEFHDLLLHMAHTTHPPRATEIPIPTSFRSTRYPVCLKQSTGDKRAPSVGTVRRRAVRMTSFAIIIPHRTFHRTTSVISG